MHQRELIFKIELEGLTQSMGRRYFPNGIVDLVNQLRDLLVHSYLLIERRSYP
jgi:hypothetical protein